MGDLKYVLWSNKHAQWFKRQNMGMTHDIALARRYTFGDAMSLVAQAAAHGRVDDGIVMIVAPEASGALGMTAAHFAAPRMGSPVVIGCDLACIPVVRCADCWDVIMYPSETARRIHTMPITFVAATRAHELRCSGPSLKTG